MMRRATFSSMDAAALLRLMWESWNEVYRDTLGHAERSLVSELRDIRNRWAHQESFSSDDAYRALDSTHRLLTAVSSQEAGEVENMKMELLRVRFDEQARTQRRRTAGTAIESQATGGLAPWREVVSPHQDVASGPVPAGRVRGGPLAGAIGRGLGRVPGPSRVFPAHLPDGQPEAAIGRRGAAAVWGRRRPCGTATDKLRRWQNSLNAGALSPLLRHARQ